VASVRLRARHLFGAAGAFSQVKTNVPDAVTGTRLAVVEHITIHGKSLEGNLEGDAADRPTIVFLPPSYASARTRRYPVVYAWHGYSIGAGPWTQEIHVPQTIEGAFARGAGCARSLPQRPRGSAARWRSTAPGPAATSG
jgi:hypothetical protein